MSQEKVSAWGVVPFPTVLLEGAREFYDCNNCLVFGVMSQNIQSYLHQQKYRVSQVVKEIFSSSPHDASGFKAKKSAIEVGLRVYRVKISSLGFKQPATRDEVMKRANRYGLVPIDIPRTWAIPLRSWYKEKDKITLFGTVHHGDVIKKVPLELMFTLGFSQEHGDYLSARKATKDSLFQPDETIIMEGM